MVRESPQISPRLDVVRIFDPLTAAALFHPVQASYLLPFFGEPTTVADAAAVCGLSPNTFLAIVRRFTNYGLVVRDADVVRRGRAVKTFRTSANAFEIDLHAFNDVALVHEKFWASVFNLAMEQDMYETNVTAGATVIVRRSGNQIVFARRFARADANREVDTPFLDTGWSQLRLIDEDASASRRVACSHQEV